MPRLDAVLLALLLMFSGIALTQAAEEPSALDPRPSSVGPGQTAKESAGQVGHSFRDAAIQIGHGARSAAAEIAQAAVKIGHAFRDAARQIGQVFRRSDPPASQAPVVGAAPAKQVAAAP